MTAISMFDWESLAVDKYSLTMGQFLELAHDEPYEFLVFDQNWTDGTMPFMEPGAVMDTCDAFAYCKATIRRSTDNNGVPTVSIDWPLLNFKLSTELEINYKGDCWYPLNQKGELPACKNKPLTSWLRKKLATKSDGLTGHWTNVPHSTRVGWRGAFVSLDALKHLPTKVLA